MKDNITILCCCGAGICTSNYLKEEIEDRMAAEKIKNVKVVICRVTDLEEQASKADLIATTVELHPVEGIPTVRALGIMLDDVAAEKALNEIVSIIKNL